jgi:hypothetical protein
MATARANDNGVAENMPLLESDTRQCSLSSRSESLTNVQQKLVADQNSTKMARIIYVLMIGKLFPRCSFQYPSRSSDHDAFKGVFVANADTTIILATNSTIASNFLQLGYASWLTTSYILAMAAAQPVVWRNWESEATRRIAYCASRLGS